MRLWPADGFGEGGLFDDGLADDGIVDDGIGGDDYAKDTGNGYYGAYQFSIPSWWAVGYSGLPSQAPATTQDAAAERLLSRSGWRAWPACSLHLGLR